MGKKEESFSREKKQEILKEAKKSNVKATIERHGISRATYYSWRKKFDEEKKEDESIEKLIQKKTKELNRVKKKARRSKKTIGIRGIAISSFGRAIKKKMASPIQ